MAYYKLSGKAQKPHPAEGRPLRQQVAERGQGGGVPKGDLELLGGLGRA